MIKVNVATHLLKGFRMKKVLVVQVSIGISAYVYDVTSAPDDFDKHLVPTVKRYCEKYGYDYKRITEYPKDIDVTFFNQPGEIDYRVPGNKQKAATLVRYTQMYQPEYDVVVSLDNDIYIPKHAEPLPEVVGHMAVQDIGKGPDGFAAYRSKVKVPNDIFVNAGVQMVDRPTGKKIYDYFKYVCDNKIPAIVGYRSDQGYMNKFRANNTEISHVLPFKWNYMSGAHKPLLIEENNFIHYCGTGRPNFYEHIKDGTIC